MAGGEGKAARLAVWRRAPKRFAAAAVVVAGAIVTLSGAYKVVTDFAGDLFGDAPPVSEFDRTPNAGLEFWQDDAAVPMLYRDDAQHVVRVVLEPAPFTLRLPAVDARTAVEVCAWTGDELFARGPRAPEPVRAHRVPCLRPGRGVADQEYASGRLSLDWGAKNYLYGNRLRSAGDQTQAYFSTTITLAGGERPLTEQRQPLYLLVYVDRNADRLIDPGEYEAVELTF